MEKWLQLEKAGAVSRWDNKYLVPVSGSKAQLSVQERSGLEADQKTQEVSSDK